MERRIKDGDALARRVIRTSLRRQLFYCAAIFLSGAIFVLHTEYSFNRVLVLIFFIALFTGQVGSLLEIRDSWKFGQVCVEMLRERKSRIEQRQFPALFPKGGKDESRKVKIPQAPPID